MEERTSYEVICGYLPTHIREAMLRVCPSDRERLSECRLRCGRAINFVCPDKVSFLGKNGKLISEPTSECVTASLDDIKAVVAALSRFSVHSKSKELTQGYFVIEHGIRVGLSGILSETVPSVFRRITGLNFRLSRQVRDCAFEIYRLLHRSFGGIIICGEVNSGKTTVLRDLCRLCSQQWKVTLIDERNEIGFASESGFCSDIGCMTDVLTGCSRSTGITMAVRTLSPDIIFCDEIATESDSAAIIHASGSGVRFAATIHAGSYKDLLRRPVFSNLRDAEVFTHAVILRGNSFPGRIAEIRRLSNA